MSTNKLYSYRCDTCRREVERLTDGRRPDPLRCVITHKCTGTMTLINKRIGFQPKLTQPVIGLDDRRFRGSAPVSATPIVPVEVASVNVFGGAGGLVIACLERATIGQQTAFKAYTGSGFTTLETRASIHKVPSSAVKIQAVLFELAPEILLARRYTFNFSSTASVIEGQDNSAQRALLRYTNTSVLKVFVNGIELPAHEYDRTNPNSITLTPLITAPSITIDVYVYRNLLTPFDESLAIRLNFEHLDFTSPAGVALRQHCAWGDIGAVFRGSTGKILAHCSSLSVLDRSKTYIIKRFEVTNGVITQPLDPAQLYMLTAQPPYAFEDKRLDRVIEGSVLTTPTTALSFRINESTGELNDLVLAEGLVTKLATRLTLPTAVSFDDVASATGTARPVSVPQQAYIIGPA